jgi:hypothetical protein
MRLVLTAITVGAHVVIGVGNRIRGVLAFAAPPAIDGHVDGWGGVAR